MIRQQIKIGVGALVGMGAVVVKDVLPYTTVAGNPAVVLARAVN
jgi:acetyltransferase-like isoleucine patch superfamily enzyme